uniref:Cellular repressor of E1A stimulated genes 2 n=1 Tax=Buteo japonicus TaxID=224669 RepID=A0A8C0HLR7_9AVES
METCPAILLTATIFFFIVTLNNKQVFLASTLSSWGLLSSLLVPLRESPTFDGPVNNSTGIPFFYVTPKDNTVADLLKNPVASLTLPEVYPPTTTFSGNRVIRTKCWVPTFSILHLFLALTISYKLLLRHPVVRKWPRSYEWFFMKMNIEHIWLQSWYGEVSAIAVEEYLKAVPSKG